MEKAKVSPLTVYIRWLSSPDEVEFPEECKSLNVSTILNLACDDPSVTLVLNSLVNNYNTYYSIPIEIVGKLHKKYNKAKSFKYISSRKHVEKEDENDKFIKETNPTLKPEEIKLLKEVNGAKRQYKKTAPKKEKKEITMPPIDPIDEKEMLVDVYHEEKRDPEHFGIVSSETAYITRIDGKKFVRKADEDVNIYYGKDDFFKVRDINTLKSIRVPYMERSKNAKRLQSKGYAVYNSDISISTIKSVEWKKEHPNESHYNLRINYIDIELYQKGYGVVDFTNIEKSAKDIPVNLITLYDNYEDIYFTFIYNMNKSPIEKEQILEYLDYASECKIDIRVFNTEKEMFTDFFNVLRKCDADIYTGWNSDEFDLPYIVYRAKKLGVSTALDRDKIMDIEYSKKVNKNEEEITYTIPKVGYAVALDYMKLYKSLIGSVKENYKLGTIAQIELGITKLDVEEGMDDIFDTEPERFIAYNINDVHLVRKLDYKLKFIDLSFGIVKFANISWTDIYTTLRICDGLIYEYLLENGKTVKPREHVSKDTLSLKKHGGFVRNPIEGVHEYSGDLDATSMYPYIMARYNISDDTLIAKISPEIAHLYLYDKDKFKQLESFEIELRRANPNGTSKIVNISPEAFEKSMKDKGHIITHIGTIFCKHEVKRSALYDIVEMLINKRKEYKKTMLDNIDNKLLYDRYDNMQKTIKIITNSLYGGQSNKYFRLYSYDVAESITVTGREIIKLSALISNRAINKMVSEKTEEIGNIEIPSNWSEESEGLLEHIIYGDSVTGDSLISSNLGKKKIEDIWDDLVTEQVEHSNDRMYLMNPGFSVLGPDGNFHDVSCIMKHKTKKKLYKIEDEFGNSVIVTEDHSVMVLRDGEEIQVRPTEILENDLLIISKL